MGRFKKGLFSLLTFSCAGSMFIHLPAFAGDGVIVLERTVQPHVATSPLMRPDPHPTTVNSNPSGQILGAVRSSELSDGDFASVSSGATISHVLMQGGSLRGINAIDRGLPGLSSGHSGASTNGVAGQVTSAVQQGLAPLRMMTGDMK